MDTFNVQGKLDLDGDADIGRVGALKALVLDRNGQIIGSTQVKGEASFSIPVSLRAPGDVQIVLGPARDDDAMRQSANFTLNIPADQWQKSKGKKGAFTLKPNLVVDRELILSWLPKRVCVSGHVRKIETDGDTVSVFPVPFAKVEIFDVDRESCWWDHITARLPELVDRRVVRTSDLVSTTPLPDPFPIPRPVEVLPRLPVPQPDPPFRPQVFGQLKSAADRVDLASLREKIVSRASQPVFGKDPVTHLPTVSGEASTLDPDLQTRLSDLTLMSRRAPWNVWPGCYHSRNLICTTTTDEQGFFKDCFKWRPLHFRRGRLRFDWRPDIIIRVTQVIDGVEHVLYLDPYTSTRWNACNTHIDLFLDDDRIVCGDPDGQARPPRSQAFFTRIGQVDEVYKINPDNGLYEHNGTTNAAYGHVLRLYGQFGDALSQGAHYYRLSYAPYGSRHDPNAFTYLNRVINDTRVNKATNALESYKIGPHSKNGKHALYEVRNFQAYLWFHPDLIGSWDTRFEDDEGLYAMRLEIFDHNGNKLGATAVEYLKSVKSSAEQPAVLVTTEEEWADLVVHVDNKPATATLKVPSVADDECGIVKWTDSLNLDLDVNVAQENGRLRHWELTWQKGVSGDQGSIRAEASSDGSSSFQGLVPAKDDDPDTTKGLLAELNETCAFAFELTASAHVRNGDGWIGPKTRDRVAIAVEKCS